MKLVPFALLWPVIKLLAPLIIRLILPLILQKQRVTGGFANFTDGEISEFLEANRDAIKSRYREG